MANADDNTVQSMFIGIVLIAIPLLIVHFIAIFL